MGGFRPNVDTDIAIVIVIGVRTPYKTYRIQSSRETDSLFEFDEFDIFFRQDTGSCYKPFRTILEFSLVLR
jgi:hypothetical protein